jgi:ubiquitin carboxyl-terminal hydrolase 4/11/15
MYLTVPLPIAQTREYRCFFTPLDPDQPTTLLKMIIPMNASFSQIKEKIASFMHCKASNASFFPLQGSG